MAIQIKKTYRGLNPEMLCDEVRGLLQKQGVIVVQTESQTYALPSGATQSRTTLALKTQAKQEKDQKECGTVHIIGSPRDEAKMLLTWMKLSSPKKSSPLFKKTLILSLAPTKLSGKRAAFRPEPACQGNQARAQGKTASEGEG